MNSPTNIWSSHLAADERIVWSASISEKLVHADLARQRLIAIGTFVPAMIVTFLLTTVFLGSVVYPATNLGGMLAPIYLAFAFATAILAVSQLFKFAYPRRPEAAHYAATSQRLVALDASGAIAGEMPASEIGDVIAGGSRPDLVVLRRDDNSEAAAFPIRFIDRPFDAKAIIEETFPQSPEPETQP